MVGIILGMMVGMSVGLLISIVTYEMLDGKSRRRISPGKILATGITIIAIMGSLIGFNIDKHYGHIYVEQYSVQKKTIEDFILRKTATDIEKMELANTAVALNKELAEKKYSADKWYGFAIDKKVLEMEYIKVSEQ